MNRKIGEIPPSGIRKFFDLIIGREDIISLGVGEPDFPVPWHIREAMIYSLEQGYTSYTSNWGLQELRDEIAEYYRKFGVQASSENVIVTTGVSEGLDLAIRSLLNPGDEIIIPEPCYVSYKPLAMMAYGNPKIITTSQESGFKISGEDILKAGDDAKVLIIGYPSNPTGTSFTKKELEEIADAVIEKDLTVISDEIYAELTYGRDHVSIGGLNGMEERTVVLNGFSKAFAMTGFRIGYAIAPEKILNTMLKIHQYTMLCAPISAQKGAIEALRNGLKDVEEMREKYDRRRRYFVKRLNSFIPCRMPEGAFYVFPSIRETGLTSDEFSERLLFEKNVAVVPGSAFGDSGEGFIRCSYATSMEKLKIAGDMMEEFLNSL